MTRKIIIYSFIIALTVTVFSFNSNRANALTNNIINDSELTPDSLITPNIACDLDLGCYTISHYDIGTPIVLFDRWLAINFYDPSTDKFGWASLYMTECDGGALVTIKTAGCAVASQASIAQKFADPTITPREVNSTVTSSCSYSAGEFVTAYTGKLALDTTTHDPVANKNIATITAIVKPYITSGRLIMIYASGYKKNSSGGYVLDADGNKVKIYHFEVINRYTYTLYTYDNGTEEIKNLQILVTDSSNKDTTLTSFMSKYPYVISIDIFKDLP
jgi:hypothetical protein